jgi:hypothetical protein
VRNLNFHGCKNNYVRTLMTIKILTRKISGDQQVKENEKTLVEQEGLPQHQRCPPAKHTSKIGAQYEPN